MSVYQPLPLGNSVIDQLMGFDTAFKNVRMYNTLDRPLFYANDVGAVLGIKKIRNAISGLDGYFVERDCLANIIVTQDSTTFTRERKVNMLTTAGLYRLIMRSNGNLATQFCVFVDKVLERLRNEGMVTLENAQEDLRAELASLKEKNEALNADNTRLIIKSRFDDEIVAEACEANKCINDPDFDVFASADNPDRLMCIRFKKLYCIRVFVYLLRPSSIKKKRKKPKRAVRRTIEEMKNAAKAAGIESDFWSSGDDSDTIRKLLDPVVQDFPKPARIGAPVEDGKIDLNQMEVEDYEDDFDSIRPSWLEPNGQYHFHITRTPAKATQVNRRLMKTVFIGSGKDFAELKAAMPGGGSTFVSTMESIESTANRMLSEWLQKSIDSRDAKKMARATKPR